MIFLLYVSKFHGENILFWIYVIAWFFLQITKAEIRLRLWYDFKIDEMMKWSRKLWYNIIIQYGQISYFIRRPEGDNMQKNTAI